MHKILYLISAFILIKWKFKEHRKISKAVINIPIPVNEIETVDLISSILNVEHEKGETVAQIPPIPTNTQSISKETVSKKTVPSNYLRFIYAFYVYISKILK
jgi:hypothetical protein